MFKTAANQIKQSGLKPIEERLSGTLCRTSFNEHARTNGRSVFQISSVLKTADFFVNDFEKTYICILKTNFMTTLTIKINERTIDGKRLLEYIKSQPIEIVKPVRNKKSKSKSALYKKAQKLSASVVSNTTLFEEIVEEVQKVRNEKK